MHCERRFPGVLCAFGDGVTLGDEARTGSRSHSVREQSALAEIDDDIALRGGFDSALPDQEHIVWPDRR
ncbi:MAG: hypothetical protein NT123_01870 [Proteobacteria bacterium]|nr:hypothetical protein [Pseudomonadota bacterium]